MFEEPADLAPPVAPSEPEPVMFEEPAPLPSAAPEPEPPKFVQPFVPTPIVITEPADDTFEEPDSSFDDYVNVPPAPLVKEVKKDPSPVQKEASPIKEASPVSFTVRRTISNIRPVREGVSKGEEDGRRPPVLPVARPQGIEGWGMAGQGETLGSPWIPLPVRA
jgi:hypothetical protein